VNKKGEFILKVVLSVFLIVLLFACAHSQYDPNIASYNIYWYKLDTEQQPPINEHYYKFQGDTVKTFSWQRGTDQGPGYQTPYTGSSVAVWSIVNTVQLWDVNNNANVQREITLGDGIYEITVCEQDINVNESGDSDPIYIEIAGVYARIQINLKIE